MIYVFLAILGLCLGSFVNALVWRVHIQADLTSGSKKTSNAKKTTKITKKQSKKSINSKEGSLDRYSILMGRSMCVDCQHELSWRDLVPVLSWLSIRGRCRYCGNAISWQYPLVELLTAVLFVISYIFWPFSGNSLLVEYTRLGLWLVVLTGMMALAVYDLRWMLLPNRILFPLIAIASPMAIIAVITGEGSLSENIINLALSLAISSGFFYLMYMLSAGKWIGGGDIVLGVLIGLLLANPYKAFLMLFLASLIGTFLVLPGLVTKVFTRESKIPFGPFLIASTFIAFIFGTYIIDWYMHTILMI